MTFIQYIRQQKEQLFETPQPAESFNQLYTKSKNIEVYNELQQYESRLLEPNLYLSIEGDSVRIYGVTSKPDNPLSFIYFFKYTHISPLKTPVLVEEYLWKSAGSPFIAADIFWKYAFVVEGSVLSDNIHTDACMNFWYKRCMEAFKKNYNVYAIGGKGTAIGLIEKGFEDNFMSYYIKSTEGRKYRFLITDKKI